MYLGKYSYFCTPNMIVYSTVIFVLYGTGFFVSDDAVQICIFKSNRIQLSKHLMQAS